jgi:hypothetical protein
LKGKPKEPEPALAKEEVEDLPEELLTKPINLMEGFDFFPFVCNYLYKKKL